MLLSCDSLSNTIATCCVRDPELCQNSCVRYPVGGKNKHTKKRYGAEKKKNKSLLRHAARQKKPLNSNPLLASRNATIRILELQTNLHWCTRRQKTAGTITQQKITRSKERINRIIINNRIALIHALINNAVSSCTRLVLGGSQTLCRRLLHLSSNLCVRMLNTIFPHSVRLELGRSLHTLAFASLR